MDPIIETKQLTHTYSAGTPFERSALLEVNFSAYAGEYLGIIGYTGSGKSTLIQHVCFAPCLRVESIPILRRNIRPRKRLHRGENPVFFRVFVTLLNYGCNFDKSFV